MNSIGIGSPRRSVPDEFSEERGHAATAAGKKETVEHAFDANAQRFREIARLAPAILWATEPGGHCGFLSAAWEHFTGTADTGRAQDWLGAFHPDDRDRMHGLVAGEAGAREGFAVDCRVRHADGGYRVMRNTGRPRLASDGRFLGYVGSLADLTVQRRAEAALKETDQRRDEFLATLAHELRNPLAPLRHGLQLMQLAGNNTEAVAQARDMMERQVEHMVRLIDDLLDVSRINVGKIELRKEWAELSAVLRAAIETARPLMDRSGHDFALAMPPEPIYLNADIVRLSQVFGNLLDNAAKYSPTGGRIRVAVVHEDGHAVVSVADEGQGIDPQTLTEIFGIFRQGDHAHEKPPSGLGIGLTIVKRLVEMHDGTVEARSAGRGHGSEFIVRLPVLASPTALQPDPAAQPKTAASGSRRILVADDNVDSASSLAMMLELMGHEVRCAYDGMAAVEAAEAFRPEIVLLDIGMPKLNGYEACQRIREQAWSSSALLVALTGWGQEEDKARAHDAGFHHHLVKPVALKSLLAVFADAGKEDVPAG